MSQWAIATCRRRAGNGQTLISNYCFQATLGECASQIFWLLPKDGPCHHTGNPSQFSPCPPQLHTLELQTDMLWIEIVSFVPSQLMNMCVGPTLDISLFLEARHFGMDLTHLRSLGQKGFHCLVHHLNGILYKYISLRLSWVKSSNHAAHENVSSDSTSGESSPLSKLSGAVVRRWKFTDLSVVLVSSCFSVCRVAELNSPPSSISTQCLMIFGLYFHFLNQSNI